MLHHSLFCVLKGEQTDFRKWIVLKRKRKQDSQHKNLQCQKSKMQNVLKIKASDMTFRLNPSAQLKVVMGGVGEKYLHHRSVEKNQTNETIEILKAQHSSNLSQNPPQTDCIRISGVQIDFQNENNRCDQYQNGFLPFCFFTWGKLLIVVA